MLKTLYLRREPSRDVTLHKYEPAALRFDVVAYRDREATDEAVRIPWHYSGLPTRRNRTMMLNCYRYAVEWLPELQPLPVVFRVFEGELLALFPTEPASWHGQDITCYAHVGQHGSACRSLLQRGRPAKPDEYADLLRELRRIYERSKYPEDPIVPLKVCRRAPPC